MERTTRKARGVFWRARLSALLCLALIFGMMPVAAFAAATDVTPPVIYSDIQATYTGGFAKIELGGWDLKPSAESTEPVSGMASIGFSIDSGAYVTVPVTDAPAFAKTSVTVTGAGTHTIAIRIIDVAGNSTAAPNNGENPLVFEIEGEGQPPVDPSDTIPPVTVSDVEATYVGKAIIKLTATDIGGSGVKSTFYNLNGAGFVEGTQVVSTRDGANTLSFYSVDNNGNEETPVNTQFTIIDGIGEPDGDGPVTTLDIEDGDELDAPATVTISASDPTGLKSLTYTLDGEKTTVDIPSSGGPATRPITDSVPAPATHHAGGAGKTVGQDTSCMGCHSQGCATCHSVLEAPTITADGPKPDNHGFVTATACSGCHTVVAGGISKPITPVVPAPTAHHLGAGQTATNAPGCSCHGAASCASCHTVTAAPNISSQAPTPDNHSFLATSACADCHTVRSAEVEYPTEFEFKLTIEDEGDYTLEAFATNIDDVDGEAVSASFSVISGEVPGEGGLTRVAGTDRFGTALLASQKNFAAADAVIIATGADFADALSASGLAGAYKAPLLLTAPKSLSAGIAKEIGRLKATKVFIVGGANAVSPAVETSLKGISGVTVTRIQGANRYVTSQNVAAAVKAKLGEGYKGGAFVARGDSFADALAASPVAYAAGMPILLTRPTVLSSEVRAAIGANGVKNVVVVGGTSAVSASVEGSLKGISGLTVERRSGANRYETAQSVAQYGLSKSYITNGFLGVATGLDFPDALAGGVASGARGGALLLTAPAALSTNWPGFLASNSYDASTSVQVYGGTQVVKETVVTTLKGLLK